MPRERMDLTGQRFGRYVAIARSVSRPQEHWLCRCDCGTEREVFQGSLRNGKSKSCGCRTADLTRQRAAHGHARKGAITPTYLAWAKIIYDANTMKLHGRFDYVDARWTDFANFLADMGEKPKGTILKRPDEHAPFGPTNCEWHEYVPPALLLSKGGKTQTVAEWARELGVTISCLYRRLDKGLSTDQVLGPARGTQPKLQ